jgi:hypothetical protein
MIQFLPPDSLSIHPAAAKLPKFAEDSPEFRGMMASVAAAGFQTPLLVSGHALVDDPDKLRIAILLNMEVVPCLSVVKGEEESAVLHALLGRKHYSKGALAYIAFPLFASALAQGRKRRLENLKKGEKFADSSLSALSGGAQTVEDLADALGIGRTGLFAARNIHGYFKKNAEMKAHFEPLILRGEMGLGAVLQGIAGWRSTKGQSRSEREQLLLWQEKIKGFGDPRKWAGWDKASPETKDFVRAELRKAIEAWPEDVRAALLDIGSF